MMLHCTRSPSQGHSLRGGVLVGYLPEIKVTVERSCIVASSNHDGEFRFKLTSGWSKGGAISHHPITSSSQITHHFL